MQDPTDTNGYLSRQPGRHLGDVRQDHRHQGHADPDHLRRRRRQGEHGLPAHRRRRDLGADRRPADRLHRPQGRRRRRRQATSTSRRATPAARTTAAKGDVWRYDAATGTWTQISPMPSSSADDYFGYSGLTIDRQHPDTIMVATPDLLVAGHQFFRSAPTAAPPGPGSGTGPATRTARQRYTHGHLRGAVADVRQQPAAAGGDAQARLDDRGAGDRPVQLRPDVVRHRRDDLRHHQPHQLGHRQPRSRSSRWRKGLEETAVLDLVSPPTGAPRWSARSATSAASVHTDLDTVPSMMSTAPSLGQRHQPRLRRAQPGDHRPRRQRGDAGARTIGVSTDGGSNWLPGPGAVRRDRRRHDRRAAPTAAASSGRRPAPASTTRRRSAAPGPRPPASRPARSSSPTGSTRKKFYAFSGGTFYVSTDGGATFTASAATGLPATGRARLQGGARREGDIWLAGGDARRLRPVALDRLRRDVHQGRPA